MSQPTRWVSSATQRHCSFDTLTDAWDQQTSQRSFSQGAHGLAGKAQLCRGHPSDSELDTRAPQQQGGLVPVNRGSEPLLPGQYIGVDIPAPQGCP